jgi:hypothetical protein
MENYNGLHFDTILATSLVFMKCEKEECDGKTIIAYCPSCVKRNKYVTFALLNPFDFEVIVPPLIFSEIYPSYGYRPITTMEILSLYIAAVEYFDMLFDPEEPFMESSEKWCEQAYGDRELAKELWGDCHQFSMELIQFDEGKGSMLDLIRVLEKRLCFGQSITAFVNSKHGKNLKDKEWEFVAERAYKVRASTQLVLWGDDRHRCEMDQVKKKQLQDQVVNLWNPVRVEKRGQLMESDESLLNAKKVKVVIAEEEKTAGIEILQQLLTNLIGPAPPVFVNHVVITEEQEEGAQRSDTDPELSVSRVDG